MLLQDAHTTTKCLVTADMMLFTKKTKQENFLGKINVTVPDGYYRDFIISVVSFIPRSSAASNCSNRLLYWQLDSGMDSF